ncbi:2-succinyl-6-hydroxy-2,4-cyclohexadiene-1-carboxylate synthase [Bacillus sp. Au-Bac7]|uniref:2-succinyl-6-hydroxy-2, 4-cyclohexadiene-1-carboxylate synthase n=1 Tax=Bacillus sp. Au-Bac7 TaxID=2906458 RepID=UPI001E4CC937|nr:2-succinyl-6-hydroxy-2,4-cyclohexadiene-1-carboxylate synthase [Bacillus sp. Au-Bac7]MCE4051251.1 2-succinyl-6-hydroxy-2,4-cyclohexadiene-1-carboxylate synthase [Bacillus sp. Au-Bac7]
MNIVVDNISYHVEVYGSGEPLLLLHGFTGDSSTWQQFIPVFEKNHQIIMMDIIGHGQTASPDEQQPYKIEYAAKAIKKLLETLEVDSTNLLGYSMGGRLALTFAFIYPDMVRNLVLESATPGLKTEEERRERRIMDEQLGNYILKEGVNKFVNKWENIPLFATQTRLSKDVKEKIRSQRLMNNPVGLANSLEQMGTGSQPSWWERLGELKCPTLLLTGKLDEKFCRIAGEMQKQNENFEWINVDDAGHAIHVEKPEIFGTIVSEFLSNSS